MLPGSLLISLASAIRPVFSIQTTPVAVWAFAGFATVAAAVTAFFWKSNTVAMAATTGRREAMMSGVAAAGAMAAQPAFAAYGDSANVFGKRAVCFLPPSA